MAKFHLSKLNSWVTTLVLTSIGLHGLVLALPMPDLTSPPVEPAEIEDSEVIQVVTLPKLATTSDSPKVPLPEPPPEPPTLVEAPDELVLTDPEILDQVELEKIEPVEWEEAPMVDEGQGASPVDEDELTLDQRIASRDSYNNYSDAQIGPSAATDGLSRWLQQTGSWPTPWEDLESTLTAVVVPLQECLEQPPAESISFAVMIGPDGTLVSEPELLNSTGYGVLDEKALEIARTADYAAHHAQGETKDYSFSIKVDYEACELASLTNSKPSS